eukprot:4423335-Amphidinium_carterae.2
MFHWNIVAIRSSRCQISHDNHHKCLKVLPDGKRSSVSLPCPILELIPREGGKEGRMVGRKLRRKDGRNEGRKERLKL